MLSGTTRSYYLNAIHEGAFAHEMVSSGDYPQNGPPS